MFSRRLGRAFALLCLVFSFESLADAGPVNPAVTNQLKPFTTDGCSNWFDGTFAEPNAWRHCCVIHDKAYWIGGTAAERSLADNALKACVTKTGHSFNANYMYFWIRLGGHPRWPTPYRWGYGWQFFEPTESAWLPKQVRGYRALTEVEQQQVAELLPQADQRIADDDKAHPAVRPLARQIPAVKSTGNKAAN